MENQMVIL